MMTKNYFGPVKCVMGLHLYVVLLFDFTKCESRYLSIIFVANSAFVFSFLRDVTCPILVVIVLAGSTEQTSGFPLASNNISASGLWQTWGTELTSHVPTLEQG